ncbi:uncharacterized protein LOC142364931 isoform X6 [Opisthocomus hoazin]|uniref:uncharacterized protein LOC142364931 isoform X6 n=1 Tax=Opisthocomus hoazin TaxID=30419 RepID=UPI003F52D772
MLEHSFSKEIFPNIQSEPPLTQLEGIATQRHQQGACVHRRFLAPSFLEFLKDGSPRVGPRAGDGKEQSSAPPGDGAGITAPYASAEQRSISRPETRCRGRCHRSCSSLTKRQSWVFYISTEDDFC